MQKPVVSWVAKDLWLRETFFQDWSSEYVHGHDGLRTCPHGQGLAFPVSMCPENEGA